MSSNELIAITTSAKENDAAFGLWLLARSWRTFPGARLTNGQGLKAASRFEIAQ
jgi:hypothetical protein